MIMKQLRFTVALLLTISSLFLYMEQQTSMGIEYSHLGSNDATLIIFSLLLIILLPFWAQYSVKLPLILWLGTLLFVKTMRIEQTPWETVMVQIHIAEVSVTALLVFLSHRLNLLLHEFAEAVQDIALDNQGLQHHYPNIDAAQEQIRSEFTRAREGQRKLSLLVIEPRQVDFAITLSKMMQEIQQAIVTRYTFARMAKVIHQKLRRTDLILQDQSGKQIILLCPEADTIQSTTLLNQITTELQEQLNVQATWTSATFPEDGYTFDGLMARAQDKLAIVQESTLHHLINNLTIDNHLQSSQKIITHSGEIAHHDHLRQQSCQTHPAHTIDKISPITS